MILRVLAILMVLVIAGAVRAADVQSVADYKSSITNDANGKLDLKVELNYNNANTNMPIAVVMHGFSTTVDSFADVRDNARRLRDRGFFVLSVAMRGRNAGGTTLDGTRDSGGLEIYDIYDAVEHVKANYGGLVDKTNVSITGYSGGGGNVMSAVTKFPDYFRAASSFFGMSDYGYDATNGWYNNGGGAYHATLNANIGDPNSGSAIVKDRYMARASNLASMNNPYTEIHLFADSNEAICPPINNTLFKDKAVAAASYAGEFNNITVHVGDPTGNTYQDFNNNGVNEANERQRWPHGYLNDFQQPAGELWYIDRLKNGQIASPTLNSSDRLFVGGFVKTNAFEIWLGDGQNAAGLLDYSINDNELQFTMDVVSSNNAIKGWVDVNMSAYTGTYNAYLNGQLLESFQAGGHYRLNNFGEGDTLRITAVPEPVGMLLPLAAMSSLLCRRTPQR